MMRMYEAPTVVQLGDFHQDTGIGLGGQIENWFPIRDTRN